MTQLLARLFIKNHDDLKNPAVRTAYGCLVSIVGICCNLLLFAGKFTVGLMFSAVSIQADAFNNLSDAGSQLISLICFRIAAKPADRAHPFGHARIEYVASMIVSMLIVVISYELFSESIGKLFSGEEKTEFSYLTVGVLSVSVLVKLWLSFLNRSIGKKIDSSVMRATSLDSLSDAVATGAVLVSVLVMHFFSLPFDLDAVMGLAVSVFVCVAGVKILLEAKNAILGEAPEEEVVKEIREETGRAPEILGIHDLIVHNYGPGRIYASIHAEVDGGADVFHTHDVIDNIERNLREKGIEATIHMDPIVTDDEKINALRTLVAHLVAGVDPSLQIHDFRFVAGTTHTNLIFDVMVPFEVKRSDDELKKEISEKIREVDPNYYAVMKIDRG